MLPASPLIIPKLLFNVTKSSSYVCATPFLTTLTVLEFWATDSQLWFIHVEAQFRCDRDELRTAKYGQVVSVLNPTIPALILGVLLSPPPDDPYDVLRRKLLRRAARSESRRIGQLRSS
ncbi:hypothetical protein MRX96_041909 [Rhipicephalus microplus]